MKTFLKSLALASVFVASVLASATARATPYILKLVQKNGNVVATGSGAINLAGVSLTTTSSTSSGVLPDQAFLSTGGSWDVYTVAGPTGFGGYNFSSFSSSSGTLAGIYGYFHELFVPINYSSETNLSGTATWAGASFASLGVNPGIYRWTWGNGPDQTFTLDIAVPEPSALALFAGGLLLLGAFVGLRRRMA